MLYAKEGPLAMFRLKKPDVNIYIPQKALDAIFAECDGFDFDETGGRLIGTYLKKGNKYSIEVSGIIEPGPKAKRSATSFFQDGEHQAEIFRSVEKKYPEVEHLGSWHTHHVNGLTTLSSGDRTTYQKIVNHHLHNTDFFYALLVVEKRTGCQPRYLIKHYFLRRKDSAIYEIPDSQIHIIDKPLIWPPDQENQNIPSSGFSHSAEVRGNANQERVRDQEFFSEFYPAFKALFSKNTNIFYWKGKLNFVDDTSSDVLVMENQHNSGWVYSITAGDQRPLVSNISTRYKDRTFKSARHAISSMEKDINREIYSQKESSK